MLARRAAMHLLQCGSLGRNAPREAVQHEGRPMRAPRAFEWCYEPIGESYRNGLNGTVSPYMMFGFQ